MQQICFRLGSAPDLAGEDYSVPHTVAGFKGPTSGKGRGGKVREGMGGKKRRRKGREEKVKGEEKRRYRLDIPRKKSFPRPWYLLFTSICILHLCES